MTEQELYEKWQRLTIRDNFIFSKIMEEYPNLCQQLLEKILHIKITKISYPEREKVLESRLDSKGVRLDVYVEDKGANRSFDVEMQISDSDNLAKRMRYYQGLIDMDKLKRGQHYGALGESFIIFICPFDKFKEGRHIYTFKEICAEDTEIKLGDGATKIFLSTKGTRDDVDKDVKAFLDYVESGLIEGEFVGMIKDAFDDVKTMKRTVKEFMTYEMTLLENRMAGHAEGLAQGLAQGIAQGLDQGRAEMGTDIALKMLRDGMPVHKIQEWTKLPIERIQQIAAENFIALKVN